MTAATTSKTRIGAALAAPIFWLASLVNIPLKAWQRATGTGGMAAFFLAPNMAIFGIFYHLVPSAADSRLAKVHFALMTLGVWILVPGIAMAIWPST